MNIYGYTFAHLKQFLVENGEKPAKARFITRGLYKQKVTSFNDMKDVKNSIKNRMEKDFEMVLPEIIEQVESKDSSKFLFALSDGNIVEAVLMNQKYGNSLCISTQVGCNMGCTFCQSGRQKKIRDLQTWEMSAQLIVIEQRLCIKISNVVLMGIGEPFDNYSNVMDFISILNHPHMLNIGARHISASTCGIVPRIYDYMNHTNAGLLAISLHAPNNSLRDKLMPVNRSYPLEKLMEAIDCYIASTNKKVMLEYVMLKDINDSTAQAQELAKLIGNRNCHVNLIPYNQTQNLGFSKSSFEQIMAFYDILKKNKIKVTMRREIGASVNAACGQLRADYTS